MTFCDPTAKIGVSFWTHRQNDRWADRREGWNSYLDVGIDHTFQDCSSKFAIRKKICILEPKNSWFQRLLLTHKLVISFKFHNNIGQILDFLFTVPLSYEQLKKIFHIQDNNPKFLHCLRVNTCQASFISVKWMQELGKNGSVTDWQTDVRKDRQTWSMK